MNPRDAARCRPTPGRALRTALGLGAVLLFGIAIPSWSEPVDVTAMADERVRTVRALRDDDNLLLPLFACAGLLEAEGRWDPRTNRWRLFKGGLVAEGFLDEPLVLIDAQPFLVKRPSRLVEGKPYLSFETLRLLGRHGWELEVVWDEASLELTVRPARLKQTAAAEPTRVLAIPEVPPGLPVVVLDAGHPRSSGVRGLKGLTEGDVGLRLAVAVSATLNREAATVVTLQDGEEALDPREVASVANALEAKLVISFHASQYGSPALAVWSWGRDNILAGTGIAFDPFEPPGGWAEASDAQAPRSAEIAASLVAAFEDAGLPTTGPFPAPLVSLEGLTCPAVVVALDGIGTPDGAALAETEAFTNLTGRVIAGVVAAVVAAEGRP